jgi:polyisoprenyl-phosphate glycosyltransferase
MLLLNVPLISIVTPVFQEEEGIQFFYSEVLNYLQELDLNFEIIFCLDPSTDGTQTQIERICALDSRVKLIVFSRRIGQDLALMAGLEHSNGDCVIVMDSDLQDPPSLIPSLIEKWQEGYKVVLAKRTSRLGENSLKRLTSKLFYKLMRKFSDNNFPEDSGDFRLLDRIVVNEVIKFRERQPFLRALMAKVGFNTTSVEFIRPARSIGETKYNRFLGGYKIGMKSILNYSNLLLKLNLVIGLFVAICSFITAVFFVIAKLFGANFASGVTTIVFSIWFIGGVILTGLGVLGLYVGRLLEEVKSGPSYIVEKLIGFTNYNQP